MIDPIALSVPAFFIAMGVEAFVAKRRGVKVYRFTDSITDLSCGISSQLEAVLVTATRVAIYEWLFVHRLTTIEGWPAWVVAFFGVDFLYYWWHRASHEINFFWAAHVVHHQSEDYNLAVALRQSITTSWSSLPFYLPLALLGVPVSVFLIVHSLSTLYQFWIHTQLVGKIRGPLDWILNLPQHHRVHHAINPQYLDKNYGATLIIWDRLFGTYEEEVEPCVYGITTPLGSFNPVWAQFHYWVELVQKTFTLKGLDRLKIWVVSPAWKPAGTVVPPVDLQNREKFDVTVPKGTQRYVRVQYVILLLVTSVVMLLKTTIPWVPLVLACVSLAGGLTALGGLLEKKRWAWPLEVGRVGGLVAAGAIALVV
jgi:alkylglycerol monooxygenase